MNWTVYAVAALLLAMAGASIQIAALAIPGLMILSLGLLGAAAGALILMADTLPLDD